MKSLPESEFSEVNSVCVEGDISLPKRPMSSLIVLLGATGRGKSTLIHAIGRLRIQRESYVALSYYWGDTPGVCKDMISFEQSSMHKRDHLRKLDVADLLFNTLGSPEPSLADISHIIHILTCILVQLLFRNFSVFPGTVRPRCTTMPWTIWPALVVLWGVCWMFYPSQSDMQTGDNRTLRSETRDNQQEVDFWLSWETDPIQTNFRTDQPVQQQFNGFEDHSQHLCCPSEGPRRLPWAEDQLMIGDTPLDLLWTDIELGSTYSALTLQATEIFQQANYRVEPNNNHQFNPGLLHLEAEDLQSLSIDVRQDIYAKSAISLVSTGCSNVSPAQLVSNESTKPSNQIVFTTEDNVECGILDHNTLMPRGNKVQQKVKDHSRRFLCNVKGCNLSFTRAYELNRHKKTVHGEGQRFPCPKPSCKFSMQGQRGPFRRKDKLRDHINNVHPDIDLASMSRHQQLLRATTHHDAGKETGEHEPNTRDAVCIQPCKRGRASFEGTTSEAQESSDTELNHLRRTLEELREENRQMQEKHVREVEDLKDQNQWLRKMFEEVMKRTGGCMEISKSSGGSLAEEAS